MIRVFEPELSFQDKLSVIKSLRKNYISGTSPVVQEFEEKAAITFNRKYAVAVSNGSVALDIAFQLFDFEEGDEVIIPSFTIISCLAAVVRAGAKPVFCDVDSKTWNVSLDNIASKVTSKTKAILVVHTYGLSAEIKKISEFCSKNNFYLIEDAAEAHGQKDQDLKCGSFGDISTMSFYANKHVTTGEGGMVLTNSEEYYEKIKSIRNLDFTNKGRFKHENLYWNYRLGGLQAALGISQLSQIEKQIKNKINQGRRYQNLLKEHNSLLTLPLEEIGSIKNHYWVFGVLLKIENIRDEVIEDLFNRGIETRPFFWPLHLQNALPKEFVTNEKLLNSENLGLNGLYLPMGRHVSAKKQKYVVQNLIEVIRKFN